jgi:hypothetical protein
MTVAPSFQSTHLRIAEVIALFLVGWSVVVVWCRPRRTVHRPRLALHVWIQCALVCFGVVYVLACLLIAVG